MGLQNAGPGRPGDISGGGMCPPHPRGGTRTSQAAHYGHGDLQQKPEGLQPHELLQRIEIPTMGCLGLMGGLNPGLNPQLPKISRDIGQQGD